MNIWNSYFGSWYGRTQEFPIQYTSDFNPKWRILCHNQSELVDAIFREYGESFNRSLRPISSATLYRSVLGKCDQRLLLDRQTQEMIARYNYCKSMNCPPYWGGYDDQPAIWVDFCSLMANEISKCHEHAAKVKNG